MIQDVLFELGTEELPSGLVESLAKELLSKVESACQEAGLNYTGAQYFATPRRLAFILKDVAEQLPTRQILRKGPSYQASMTADGKPSPALLGFARSCGVELSELKLIQQEKASWWEFSKQEPGVMTQQFLPEAIQKALQGLTIPKPMRWGAGSTLFARPLHWAVLLFGEQVIEAEFLGIKSGNQTTGHRFMHPHPIQLKSASSYVEQMKLAFVMVDFAERRQEIIRQVEVIAHEKQWYIPLPPALLNEITSIVEWPVVMIGDFEQSFLTVPTPVLTASMHGHQKCLPVYNKSHQLQAHFVTVSNLVSRHADSVRLGNEKVMRARLSDAMFFYEQDRRQALEQYAPLTETVVFEERLGTLADKTQRVLSLATFLGHQLDVNLDDVSRAVQLSKCDLMTGLVGEFPELQGVIGQFYARGDGESAAVVDSMFEQYLPRFSGDELPKTDIGLILSLADRIDTLVGIFAIGMKPTGEKDPFKLRRHALAVVRLLLHKPNRINIDDLLQHAFNHVSFLNVDKHVPEELKQFIIERMQSYYLQKGYPIEWFNAGVQAQSACWYDLSLRLESFSRFMQTEQSLILIQAAKRVKQILLQVDVEPDEVQVNLLHEASEKDLWQVVQKIKEAVYLASNHQQYDDVFQCLVQLALPMASFFEQVFVMSEDMSVRLNRMALLSTIQKLLQSVVMIGA
jgi:glycyl-tRNA synthetase beta chain